MARPESIKDILSEDLNDQFATFQLDKLSSHPHLLRIYANLLDEVEKIGGFVERSDYSLHNVTLFINKDAAQLKYQLKQMQARWDRRKESYDKAVLRDGIGDLHEWQRDDIRRFAEEEGLPNPFDPFASTNEDLQAIRAELGMD